MRYCNLTLLLCFPFAAAYAQTPPSAGSLLQEIERNRPSILPGQKAPLQSPVKEMQAPAGDQQVLVKSFRFAGNTLLSEEQLAAVVAPYQGRSLSFLQLQAIAVEVAKVYREAGWIVRAYLPQQDITDGAITIQIIEAVFGGAVFEGDSSLRTQRELITQRIERQQAVGATLSAEAIDRALLLIDDLPGVIASGFLRQGAREGETELMMKLADGPLATGDGGIDNTGSRSTGRERLSANVNFNSPFGFGELIGTNAMVTKGSDYLRVGMTVPLQYDGWRIGANASHLNYKLVAAEFIALNGKGTSDTVGIEASYPVIRSRRANLYFNAALDQKQFDNQANNTTTTRYKLDSLTLGLTGNLFDSYGGGGANSASLALIQGDLNLDGSPNQAADAITAQTAGAYSKWRYALSRQQVISKDLSVFAAFSGQHAGKNLDSSEKFSLGGVAGVRAYPSSEGSGAHGQLLSLELRYRAMQGVMLTVFHDTGRITVHKNEFAGAPALNTYGLRGSGVALAWQAENSISLKGVWARRDGGNPNPTATGKDQDGSLMKDRFWLTASLAF